MSELDLKKIEILEREVAVKERELEHKFEEARKNAWRSPLVVAVFAAAIGAFSNAGLTYYNSHLSRTAAATEFTNNNSLAELGAERERILEMIKIGEPTQVQRNLQFLIDTKLVKDSATVESIEAYYADRDPSTGPGASQSPSNSVFQSIWTSPQIPVCWENPDRSDAQLRELVRSAIAETWSAHSAVDFIGWSACDATSPGVRIKVSDEPPHTKGFGRQLAGVTGGVVLNLSFEQFSPECGSTLEYCIRGTAVHVFGHVLGLFHEHNRIDRADDCIVPPEGQQVSDYLTPYDPSSVMNYCNPRWNNDGELSALDIRKVQILYGMKSKVGVQNNRAAQ